ncbi:MAG: hypothetical protein KJ621_08575 [Proteobacteria bacterium]|nr:hypothetical protein [Pseudomonadota bacterium]
MSKEKYPSAVWLPDEDLFGPEHGHQIKEKLGIDLGEAGLQQLNRAIGTYCKEAADPMPRISKVRTTLGAIKKLADKVEGHAEELSILLADLDLFTSGCLIQYGELDPSFNLRDIQEDLERGLWAASRLSGKATAALPALPKDKGGQRWKHPPLEQFIIDLGGIYRNITGEPPGRPHEGGGPFYRFVKFVLWWLWECTPYFHYYDGWPGPLEPQVIMSDDDEDSTAQFFEAAEQALAGVIRRALDRQ